MDHLAETRGVRGPRSPRLSPRGCLTLWAHTAEPRGHQPIRNTPRSASDRRRRGVRDTRPPSPWPSHHVLVPHAREAHREAPPGRCALRGSRGLPVPCALGGGASDKVTPVWPIAKATTDPGLPRALPASHPGPLHVSRSMPTPSTRPSAGPRCHWTAPRKSHSACCPGPQRSAPLPTSEKEGDLGGGTPRPHSLRSRQLPAGDGR